MNDLDKIFEDAAPSYTEDLFYQEGILDYVEDLCWNRDVNVCSAEHRSKIEEILSKYPEHQKGLQSVLDYENANGEGSLRRYMDEGWDRLSLPRFADELTR